MANQRHPNQRLVAFALDQELLAALDQARRAAGKDRSSYIRTAIAEKLGNIGAGMLKDSPDRTGKTYKARSTVKYPSLAKKPKKH